VRTPPLVLRAQEAARALGFTLSTTDEDGALLHVLAARRGVLRVGEIGTGTGVGTAWLSSALAPGTPLVTCDVDPERVAAARGVFADDPDVRVLEGDWRAVLPPEGPFDLLFCDGGHAKDDPDAVLGLVAPRGTVVLDDFFAIPPEAPDQRRDGWLLHPEVVATQVWTSVGRRAIVAVRT
jgi:predicted O-methyltransferase YrrM